MEIDRRRFIKIVGATTGALLLPWGDVRAKPSSPDADAKGMLTDLTKCIGCGWCSDACREWNDLSGGSKCPDGQPAGLSADDWTIAECQEVACEGGQRRIFIKRQCMHCLDPACVSACPVGALQKLDEGPVTYDASRCIGCRYCMVACPFGMPKFDWDVSLPVICKCTFCVDRQQEGMIPACAEACPTGALTFGDRDELIAEAEARIQAEPEKYVDHIYGQDEIGGTSWMYLSPVPFEELGFPVLKSEPVTALSETIATYGTAAMAVGVTAFLASVAYLRNVRGGSGDVPEYIESEEGEA